MSKRLPDSAEHILNIDNTHLRGYSTPGKYIKECRDCELFEDCGTCSLVTYLDGNEVSRTPALPYCGDDYDEKKNDPGTYIGDNWAIWECE